MIDPENIVGIAEIGERLGVTNTAVINWRNRHHSFPRAIRVLKTGSFYDWREVSAWATRMGKPIKSDHEPA